MCFQVENDAVLALTLRKGLLLSLDVSDLLSNFY